MRSASRVGLCLGLAVAAVRGGDATQKCSPDDTYAYGDAASKYESCIAANPVAGADIAGFCGCAGDYVARLSKLPLACETAHLSKDETIDAVKDYCTLSGVDSDVTMAGGGGGGGGGDKDNDHPPRDAGPPPTTTTRPTTTVSTTTAAGGVGGVGSGGVPRPPINDHDVATAGGGDGGDKDNDHPPRDAGPPPPDHPPRDAGPPPTTTTRPTTTASTTTAAGGVGGVGSGGVPRPPINDHDVTTAGGGDGGSGGGGGGGGSKLRPPIKDLFEKRKGGLKDIKMSELRDASKKMKGEGGEFEDLSAEDIEDAFTLLKDFAKDEGVDKKGLAGDAVAVMSDMMDKDLMRKARESLKDEPPAKRKEFERKVSEAAKDTRHAIAKFGLQGKGVGFETKLEEDGLRMLLKKKGRGEMGTADTWVQAHDSDGAAKFKLPKSFAHKLPARVANDVGMVAWENPSPWAQEGKTVKSHVNGLSLFDDAGEPVKVHGLAASEAIEIVFPGAHWPKARCSWWDAEGTEWKTDGVETEHRAADTLCKTTHLTEFALVESDEAVATALGGSGVGGGGFSASPPTAVDRAKNGHGAPSCMSNCYLHYAYKTALPKNTQPGCALWTDYLFGAECASASLKHSCAGEAVMTNIVMKCIDSGCAPDLCMGKANTADMAARLAAPTVTEGCNKVFYASAAVQCRHHETACAEGLKPQASEHSGRSITMLRGLFCNSGACDLFGACIKQALLSSRCESTSLGAGYEKFASTQVAVCSGKPAAQPCVDQRKESYLKTLRNEGKLAAGADWSASQTCDYYRDYVFGSAPAPHMHSSLVDSSGGSGDDGGSYSGSSSYSGSPR